MNKRPNLKQKIKDKPLLLLKKKEPKRPINRTIHEPTYHYKLFWCSFLFFMLLLVFIRIICGQQRWHLQQNVKEMFPCLLYSKCVYRPLESVYKSFHFHSVCHNSCGLFCFGRLITFQQFRCPSALSEEKFNHLTSPPFFDRLLGTY